MFGKTVTLQYIGLTISGWVPGEPDMTPHQWKERLLNMVGINVYDASKWKIVSIQPAKEEACG